MSGPVRAKAKATPRERRAARDRVVRANDPFTLVLFGASGDLARRKLLPALHHLEREGWLPDDWAVVGFARSEMTDASYRDEMRGALRKFVGDAGDELLSRLHYQRGDAGDAASFEALKKKLDAVEKKRKLPGNRLYYLAVAPEHFAPIVKGLGDAGLVSRPDTGPWTRVVVEKPFGRDLASARELNHLVRSVLDESQIYRIDHYLGKETVQNILSFRFGNSIFEPLFSEKYVDHVQITVAEDLGMEGKRGAYYDGAGALRDMVQNHLLQLLTLIAMEPPASLEAQAIRDEKVKVVRMLAPMTAEQVAASTVRGQYAGGSRDGSRVKAYREEEGVRKGSSTETFVALRVHLDNWRWAGVPFFLRSGKRLARRVSEIAVRFKQPPACLFEDCAPPLGNELVMRIQPDEGISLSFACKQPGMKIELAEVDMDFYYGEAFEQRSPEAYERLLLDALRGDPALFTRSDEVEYAWRFITSIHDGWARASKTKLPSYAAFSEGPEEAARLLDGRGGWRPIAERSAR